MSATKLRWGLVGCGDIARKRIAPALTGHPKSELWAVSRRDAEQAEAFAHEFGASRWYPAWEQLIRDPEIDAVYVATPVHLHAAQTIAADRAGKHVLCGKPYAMNVAECEAMIAAAKNSNVRLGVAYYRHFYPVVRRIGEIMAAREIGTPVLVQVKAFEWFDPEPSHPRRWLIEKQLSGGGPMFDFGCHRIQLLLHLFGEVKRVRSLLTNARFRRQVEDTAGALFEFEGGTQAVLTVTHAAAEPQDTLEIFGTEGSIHVRVLNDGVMTVRTKDGERTESCAPSANLHWPLIDDFITAVMSDRAPEVGGEVGRSVAQLEQQIYEQNTH